ncbi:MAG: hypothetical protein Q9207_006148 [Kuettlingeria erythrocarpa]
MASVTPNSASEPINLLDYLRSRTSVDIDCLDVKGEYIAIEATERTLTENTQWETYIQLCDPKNAALLSKSVGLARELQAEHGGSVTSEELAMEIAVCGAIFKRANPLQQLTTVAA